MTKLPDGNIVSSTLEVGSGEMESNAGMYDVSGLQVGQVIEVLYTDSTRNVSGRFVEYDVLVNEHGITSSVYRNCRTSDVFGSENNFCERVLQGTTDGTRGKKDNTEAYVYKNGAIVLVGCISNNKESPVIICALPHPAINLEATKSAVSAFSPVGSSESRDERLTKLPTLNPGAKVDEGQRILGEFQGLRWNINKDGELTILYQGPKNAQGELTAAATQPTVIKITKDGEILCIDNLDQELKISRKDQKIYISSGNTDPDYIEIDRAAKKITVDAGNQTVVVAKKVSIGGVSADEPLVLGNKWKAFYNNMIATQLNPLIAAVAALQASYNGIYGDLSQHTHDVVVPTHGTITSGGPSASGAPDAAAIPPPAPPSAPPQYSDFCFTKKKYSGE